jgi:uncharacterized protein (TIGR00369 family)
MRGISAEAEAAVASARSGVKHDDEQAASNPSIMLTPEQFNLRGTDFLPGHLGIVIEHVDATEVRAALQVRKALMAPNGYLHAGTVVTLADTSAGYGCLANLPAGASGFTTIELKSNHLGTARDGTIDCRATAVHLGRTTQVWDAVVTHRETGRTIALFRCTQMVLYAAGSGA